MSKHYLYYRMFQWPVMHIFEKNHQQGELKCLKYFYHNIIKTQQARVEFISNLMAGTTYYDDFLALTIYKNKQNFLQKLYHIEFRTDIEARKILKISIELIFCQCTQKQPRQPPAYLTFLYKFIIRKEVYQFPYVILFFIFSTAWLRNRLI